MNEAEYEKLSEIARRPSSMTFVLNGYCENFEQDMPEFANLTNFTKMLNKVSEDLYGLL